MVSIHQDENSSIEANRLHNEVDDIENKKPFTGDASDTVTSPAALKPSNVKNCTTKRASANPPLTQLPADDSRLSELARPANRGFAPSRAELQKQYQDRCAVRRAEERLLNEKTMHNAIHHPQTEKTVQSRGLTVPHEFKLSTSNAGSRSNTPAGSRCTTPQRSRCTTPLRSRCTTPRSISSDMSMCSDGAASSRGRSSSRRGHSTKALTVAHGPDLRTSYRPRSCSRQRVNDFSAPAWEDTLHGQSSRGPATPSRSTSRKASASPARSAFGSTYRPDFNPGMVTPRRNKNDESSISSDMDLSVPGSVRSRMTARSCDSRLSSLSQRSHRGKSTEEIEEMRIAAKRYEVKQLMKLNERRGRQAIHCPVRHVRRSTSLTVPKEFNLSCSGTPSRSMVSDGGSECAEQPWSRSLRSVPHSPSRAWQPELTVPEGPSLRTERRARSTSACRSASGTPSKRSMSHHRLPREQEAIERHLERVAPTFTAADDASAASTKPAWNDRAQPDAPEDELDEWVRAAETPEVRAQRRREVAERRQKEKADKTAAKVKCFTGAKVGSSSGREAASRQLKL